MPKVDLCPLVSVIVPSYNHTAFIEEALDSVYNQSYKNIELIVIDDQSKDDTFIKAQTWATLNEAHNRFSRIIIEKNEVNLGAHHTINRGLSMAKGKWLTILNSDDRYTPSRIDKLISKALESRANLLFTGVRVIDDNGKRCQNSTLAAQIESAIDLIDCYPTISFALLKKNIAISTGNLFFSSALLREIGDFKSLKYCHDWDFILRACLISEPIAIEEALYDYRIHGANSFAALKLEQFLETQAVYRYYFSSISAGNCANQLVPSSINWPKLYERFIPEDQQLSGAFYLVGSDIVKYDHMARMIKEMIK